MQFQYDALCVGDELCDDQHVPTQQFFDGGGAAVAQPKQMTFGGEPRNTASSEKSSSFETMTRSCVRA